MAKTTQATAKMSIDYGRYHAAVADLLKAVLALQVAGDKARLEELLADYAGTVLLVSHDRAFLDAVERIFGGAPEDRKNSHLAQCRNAIIAPFAQGDHAAVKCKDNRQFGTVEMNLLGQGLRQRERGWWLHSHLSSLPPLIRQIKRRLTVRVPPLAPIRPK